MTDLEQKRRTVRVLELMNDSFEAHTRGDGAASNAALDEAMALDAAALVGIQGGMLIGEIPNPERDWPGWIDYLAVNRDALYVAEHGDDDLETGHLRDPKGDEDAHG